MSSWTYKTDEGLYDVEKLSDEAKISFQYLAEVEADGLCENDLIAKEGVQVGSIAQEIQAILPDCVSEETTGVLSVNPDNLTWHLIKAVQELSAKNDELETRLAALEG